MTEAGEYSRRSSAAPRDRYTAVVAALLDVRIDHPTQRFDTELDTALGDGRIDASTARTLRWWQRTSVRAAEHYASSVVPAVLMARDDADGQAWSDVDDSAKSWDRATNATPRVEQRAHAEQIGPAIRAAFRQIGAAGQATAASNTSIDLIATTVTSE
jgi:hypothetical protein